jgi:hypothetical protein
MKRFEYINSHIDTIRKEIKIGLMPTSILRHYAIYSRFDYYRKLKYYVGISVFYTSEDMEISETTIYKVIKNMEEEIL